MKINTSIIVTTAVGALVAAFVVYQVKKRTKGIIDDE
jgi:hypothetical protein